MKVLNNLNPRTVGLMSLLDGLTPEPSLRGLNNLGDEILDKKLALAKKKKLALAKLALAKKKKLALTKKLALAKKKKPGFFSKLYAKGKLLTGKAKRLAGKAATAASALGVKTGLQKEVDSMSSRASEYDAVISRMEGLRTGISKAPDSAEGRVGSQKLQNLISEVIGPAQEASAKLSKLAEVGNSAIASVMSGKPEAVSFGAFFAQKNQLRVTPIADLRAKASTADTLYASVMNAPPPAPSMGWTSGGGNGGGTGQGPGFSSAGGTGSGEEEIPLSERLRAAKAEAAPAPEETASDKLKNNLPLIALVIIGGGAAYYASKGKYGRR